MTKHDLERIGETCDSIRRQAEDLHAILLDEHPDAAARMDKIARYAGKVSTCIRVHGQVPAERAPGKIAETVKNVVSISRAVGNLARNLPKDEE